MVRNSPPAIPLCENCRLVLVEQDSAEKMKEAQRSLSIGKQGERLPQVTFSARRENGGKGGGVPPSHACISLRKSSSAASVNCLPCMDSIFASDKVSTVQRKSTAAHSSRRSTEKKSHEINKNPLKVHEKEVYFDARKLRTSKRFSDKSRIIEIKLHQITTNWYGSAAQLACLH